MDKALGAATRRQTARGLRGAAWSDSIWSGCIGCPRTHSLTLILRRLQWPQPLRDFRWGLREPVGIMAAATPPAGGSDGTGAASAARAGLDRAAFWLSCGDSQGAMRAGRLVQVRFAVRVGGDGYECEERGAWPRGAGSVFKLARGAAVFLGRRPCLDGALGLRRALHAGIKFSSGGPACLLKPAPSCAAARVALPPASMCAPARALPSIRASWPIRTAAAYADVRGPAAAPFRSSPAAAAPPCVRPALPCAPWAPLRCRLGCYKLPRPPQHAWSRAASRGSPQRAPRASLRRCAVTSLTVPLGCGPNQHPDLSK